MTKPLFPAALSLAGVCLAAPALAAGLDGIVKDARTGQPIPHAYVRQPEGTKAAFSDQAGKYHLDLDAALGSEVLATAPGYAPARVAAADAGTLSLHESPMVAPRLPLQPPMGPWHHPPMPSESSFGLDYSLRNLTIGFGGNGITGIVDNSLGLTFGTRTGRVTLNLSAERYRAAILLPDLTRGQAADPVFSPEVVAAEVQLGCALHPLGLDLNPYTALRYRAITSGTNGAAYSGTPWDWNGVNSAAGVGLKATFRLPWRLRADADLGYYPGFTQLDKAPYQLANVSEGKAKLGLSWGIAPGMRLGAGYQRAFINADGGYVETADIYTFGFTAMPEGGRW